ncbi:hypothetical protein C8R44DRAFT_894051 [Mycena epipterygia]|nr:hypothetical protein C8R44DRAFT_894051 [Mycena epipterygia]
MSLQYTRDKPDSDAAVADIGSLHAESPSRSDREGPSRLQWLVILSVCIMGGWVLAITLYTPKEVITVKLDKDTTDALKRSAHQVGLIVGGISTFNTGVSSCDQGHFASCVTGIISGLILTAAGLWASVPGRRSLGFYYDNATIAITDHPTSDHPAHRFITNYLGVLERNSTVAHGARVGFVHYSRTAPSRHRLVIQPSGNGIGRRQDDTTNDNDGGSVSYNEWIDGGQSDQNPSDYDSFSGALQVTFRTTKPTSATLSASALATSMESMNETRAVYVYIV